MKDGTSAVLTPTLTAVTHDSTTAVFRSDYTINNITTSDGGTYTCTVTNPIGSDSETITVVVVTGELNQSMLIFCSINTPKILSTVVYSIVKQYSTD